VLPVKFAPLGTQKVTALGDLSNVRFHLYIAEGRSVPQILFIRNVMARAQAANPVFVYNSELIHVLRVVLIAICLITASACSTLQGAAPGSSSPTESSRQNLSIVSALPAANVGQAYDAVLSVGGGSAPYHFSLSQGALPPGLSLNPASGSVSGTPTQAGNFPFTITVIDTPQASTQRIVSAGYGMRAFSLTVSACSNCLKVVIAPDNPSVQIGGKLQFGATVSNTGNPAVIWSASAGTISKNGLFVAPATAGVTTVRVVATSVVDPAVKAVTTVAITTVSAPDLKILTSNMPTGLLRAAYTMSLAASGGTIPYRWSISSGSLPNGVTLSLNTGAFSGMPLQSGNFPFTVRVNDSTGHTDQQNFTLMVSTSCGPPTYCARQDLKISQPQLPVFDMGGLKGAGRCYVPADFGLPVCRLTDSTWDPATASGGNTFTPSDSHAFFSCNDNLVFFAASEGIGYVAAFATAKTEPYMSVSHVYPTGPGSARGGWYANVASGAWSRNCTATPNRLYLKGSPGEAAQITSYDFTGYASNPGGSPATATVYNFAAGSTGNWGTTSANCLPSNANSASGWREMGGTSHNPPDAAFSMAWSLVQGISLGVDTISVTNGSKAFKVSGPTPLDTSGSLRLAQIVIDGTTYVIATVNGGGMSGLLTTAYSGRSRSGLAMSIPNDQGTGTDVAIYRPGYGCAHLNTATGMMTSDFGQSGVVSGTTDRFYLHGARLTPDGRYVFMSTDVCVPGTCIIPSHMGYIWDVLAGSLTSLCSNGLNNCGGHNADGFTQEVNQGGEFPQSEIRPFTDSPSPFLQILSDRIVPLTNCGVAGGIDTHLSWEDVDVDDSFPFIVSSVLFASNAQRPGAYNCPMVDEVFGVNPKTGVISRFAHTLITGQSWNYMAQNGMGGMSDDGQFFMFGSDWAGMLGRYDLSSGPCVNNPAGPEACRGDVFVVNLAAMPSFQSGSPVFLAGSGD
jgi:hypothetical protein